jgi:hypothetical protein
MTTRKLVGNESEASSQSALAWKVSKVSKVVRPGIPTRSVLRGHQVRTERSFCGEAISND